MDFFIFALLLTISGRVTGGGWGSQEEVKLHGRLRKIILLRGLFGTNFIAPVPDRNQSNQSGSRSREGLGRRSS